MTEYTADDFLHARFAAHPITGSVASKARMDWKWVLPGWYDTGDVTRLSDQKMADAGWVPVRDSKNNQERNREALIEHIAEQDRIIRRRNEQIAQQAENSQEAQNVIEDIEAELEGYRAMHSQQMKTITRLQENPRHLAADDITDEMERRAMRKGIEFGWFSWDQLNSRGCRAKVNSLLAAALTEPPRPEWADLADVLGDFAVADEHTGDRDDMVLARRLHERGVRVTGGN